jgi:SnoaL-like domain
VTELWELVAREQIRHTIAAYTFAGDSGRYADLAAQFTVDGVLDVHGQERAEGRAAIAALLGRNAADGAPDENRPDASRPGSAGQPGDAGGPGAASQLSDRPFFIRHFVTNVLIDPITPDEARVAAYFAVFTPAGPDHWGRYRDVFVPDGDRWLLKHRTARVDSFVPGGWYQRAFS